MANLRDVNVRIRSTPRIDRRTKAAIASVRFIRRTAEAGAPDSKAELCAAIWRLYNTMFAADLLAAPRITRRMLREKFGFWSAVAVVSPCQ